MKDTLLVGDYLFVSKFSYGYSKYSLPFAPDIFDGRIWGSEPERGDIAVFKFPPNPNIDYIKRVVGLPGDKIQMIDGALHINGEAVERKRGPLFTDDETGQIVQSYIETLPNGVTYSTLDVNDSSTDNTRVLKCLKAITL
jgi:signal peptidase I